MAASTLPQSIAEIRELLRSRSTSALELTQLTIESLLAAEPDLNAFITIADELAYLQAREVDRALAGTGDPPPLAGVPVAVKDNFLTTGVPTTYGSSILRDHSPVGDADVVARLRDAGAILVGKTNMNEFAWGLDPAVGRVNNPFDPSLTAGGSSGGSVAAVASGNLVAAIGTDSGGSVRMPAAFCRVVGVKPTHGLVPSAGKLPGCWSLSDAGPITRSTQDAITLLDCLAPAKLIADPIPNTPKLATLSGSLELCQKPVADAMRSGLDAMRAAGCSVEEIALDFEGVHELWFSIFAAESALCLLPFLGDRLAAVSPDVRDLLAAGHSITLDQYVRAQELRRSLSKVFDDVLARFDALVTPTVPSPPSSAELTDEDDAYYGDMRWTILSNLSEHPAISIPLPGRALAGVQLIGRRGGDANLLALAGRVERSFFD